MSYLSTQTFLCANAELFKDLKDLKVDDEYYTLEFYYQEHEKPCLIMHFAELEDAYTSLKLFKERMLQAQLENEVENDN